MTRDGDVYVIQGVRLTLGASPDAPEPYTGTPIFLMADTGAVVPDTTALVLCFVDLLDGMRKLFPAMLDQTP